MVGLSSELQRSTWLRQAEHSLLLPCYCIAPHLPPACKQYYHLCLPLHVRHDRGLDIPMRDAVEQLGHVKLLRDV